MITTLVVIALLVITVLIYMRQPKFGKAPDEARVALYSKYPNFKEGKFVNIHNTPDLTEGYSMTGVMYDFFFKRNPTRVPSQAIPSVKNDLHNIPLDSNVMVWFGHSSYYIQIDGKRILMDPVFSGNASPLPSTNSSFAGTDIYSVEDFPQIDYLFISHDHYDHLDYETIVALKDKVGKVICPLGVGSHLEHWGYAPGIINERNWHEHVDLDNGFVAYCEPARHFSGRGFTRCNTLWASYVLQTPSLKIFLGGDSGYDTHFAEIGNKYGPIDIVILENGQYNDAWKYIHALPHEVLQIAQDLKAKRLFPVHSGKFALANHPWDEPLNKLIENNKTVNMPLITPIIGEVVSLNDTAHTYADWWVSK